MTLGIQYGALLAHIIVPNGNQLTMQAGAEFDPQRAGFKAFIEVEGEGKIERVYSDKVYLNALSAIHSVEYGFRLDFEAVMLAVQVPA